MILNLGPLLTHEPDSLIYARGYPLADAACSSSPTRKELAVDVTPKSFIRKGLSSSECCLLYFNSAQTTFLRRGGRFMHWFALWERLLSSFMPGAIL